MTVAVAGARELVPLLARELRAGGDPSAVGEGWAPGAGAAVLVWVGAADRSVLRAAARAHVPIVGVTDGEPLPYVLDTRLVVVRPGEGFPLARIARAVGRAVEAGWPALAARLPVLRDELVRAAVRRQAVRAALAAARGRRVEVAPLLALARGIAEAYGRPAPALPPSRLLERALARALRGRLPRRRLVRGAAAFAAVCALGEGARRGLRPARLLQFGSR